MEEEDKTYEQVKREAAEQFGFNSAPSLGEVASRIYGILSGISKSRSLGSDVDAQIGLLYRLADALRHFEPERIYPAVITLDEIDAARTKK